MFPVCPPFKKKKFTTFKIYKVLNSDFVDAINMLRFTSVSK